MILKKEKIFFVFILFFLFLVSPFFYDANAAVTEPAATDTLPKGDQNITVYNPLTGDDTIVSSVNIIGNVVSAILGILGSIALFMFVFGGVTWLTSAGNDTRLKKARDTLVWATLGLIVVFSSYFILNFVLSNLVLFFL